MISNMLRLPYLVHTFQAIKVAKLNLVVLRPINISILFKSSISDVKQF